MSSPPFLPPIYPATTPCLAYSPFFSLMDTPDYSSDDGDALHTPLQGQDPLRDFDPDHPAPSGSSHTLDMPRAKHLHPSHVSRPSSPLSPFFGSATSEPCIQKEHALRSYSASHNTYDNALQLGTHPNAYHSSYPPQTKSGTLSLMSPSEPDLHLPHDLPALFPSDCHPSSSSPSRPRLAPSAPSPEYHLTTKASAYSRRFARGHYLNPSFVQSYCLGDELGAGGYGFVMTARHRRNDSEVAVKFIIKSKVPDHAWMEDRRQNRVPTEALLLGLLDHPNIVKCLDLFEDELYFYLVQELHGVPWVAKDKVNFSAKHTSTPSHASTPALTPSPSIDSDIHIPPDTPPQLPMELEDSSRTSICTSPEDQQESESCPVYLKPVPPRPEFVRRPSHDLFECIEQSKYKRLTENQARYVFAQIVEAVAYLDSQGVTHCDIKDENILVDNELTVKLVDFGSAVVVDPAQPRPLYTLFFGTTAYAASEVLQKKPYHAPPAEIWTLGVLMSYLLTGSSPFPTERDALAGRIVLNEGASSLVSPDAEDLMLRCLEPNPAVRADIAEVRSHVWLDGALELSDEERMLY